MQFDDQTLESNLNLDNKKTRHRTILVVDDNATIAGLIVLTLGRLGYVNVETASDGKEALEMAERIRPDLVILDINMPEMDGIETARHLAVLNPCSIIFSTGSCDANTERLTRETPASSYLAKPFSAAQLEAAVELAH